MGSRGLLWVRLWEVKNIMGSYYGSNISVTSISMVSSLKKRALMVKGEQNIRKMILEHHYLTELFYELCLNKHINELGLVS